MPIEIKSEFRQKKYEDNFKKIIKIRANAYLYSWG